MGVGMLINWWFEMFSDSGYADLCRSIMKSSFDLGRNTIALIEPAVGACFFFGGVLLLTPKTSPLMSLLVPAVLFFLAVAVLGLLPIPLPKPMYPEWQMEKRRQRAVQEHEKIAAVGKSSSSTLQLLTPEDSAAPNTSLLPQAQKQTGGQPKQEPRLSETDHDQHDQNRQ